MNRIQASAAFAQWLESTHPELYEALFAHAVSRGLRGFGDDPSDLGLDFSDPAAQAALQDMPVDTGNLDYVTASAYGDAVDALPGDLTSSISNNPISSSQGVTGSTSSVGNWLTSPQGLTAMANVGAATLNTLATAQMAKTQMAVIQAQAQRAIQGQSPVPVSYITNAQGQHVPVYVGQQIPTSISAASGNGTARPVTLPNGTTGYTLSSPALTSLFGGSNLIWVLLLAAGLLVAVASR